MQNVAVLITSMLADLLSLPDVEKALCDIFNMVLYCENYNNYYSYKFRNVL